MTPIRVKSEHTRARESLQAQGETLTQEVETLKTTVPASRSVRELSPQEYRKAKGECTRDSRRGIAIDHTREFLEKAGNVRF